MNSHIIMIQLLQIGIISRLAVISRLIFTMNKNSIYDGFKTAVISQDLTAVKYEYKKLTICTSRIAESPLFIINLIQQCIRIPNSSFVMKWITLDHNVMRDYSKQIYAESSILIQDCISFNRSDILKILAYSGLLTKNTEITKYYHMAMMNNRIEIVDIFKDYNLCFAKSK